MKKIQNKYWLGALLLSALSSGLASGKVKAKAEPAFSILRNKDCGFSIQYPKDAKLEIQEGCGLKVTLSPAKGEDWVEEVNMTLEVLDAEEDKTGDKTMEKPDEGESPAGTLVISGLKFDKNVQADKTDGKEHVLVTYTATGKKHQYHWTGMMTAADPSTLKKPIKDWDAEKSAQKLFDGFIQGFRPLE